MARAVLRSGATRLHLHAACIAVRSLGVRTRGQRGCCGRLPCSGPRGPHDRIGQRHHGVGDARQSRRHVCDGRPVSAALAIVRPRTRRSSRSRCPVAQVAWRSSPRAGTKPLDWMLTMLTSLWTTPRSWTAPSASATWARRFPARAGSIRWAASLSCESGRTLSGTLAMRPHGSSRKKSLIRYPGGAGGSSCSPPSGLPETISSSSSLTAAPEWTASACLRAIVEERACVWHRRAADERHPSARATGSTSSRRGRRIRGAAAPLKALYSARREVRWEPTGRC
jgi:hypothetical protein